MTDCATRLAEAESALHKLQLGQASVEVWDGDFRVRYTPASISALEAYVARLKAECGTDAQKTANARKPFKVVF
jgi:hypothetical protein